ncbi:MAG: response regulator transcription factor [Jatrophihabitantaceae bacterium]
MARILVIDDDSDIAALVGLKLELDGHSVDIEEDGSDGLARAQAVRPDVLIVDWTLPGLTGPEICAQLRSDPAMSETWMIMLTARPLDEDGIAQTGADEVVAKPFSPRKLSERVTAALDR